MKKCYIASGWFSPEWLEELEAIKKVLDDNGLNYFSPRDEAVAPADASLSLQDKIFSGNIKGMQDSDWMICNTRNKDMGSIFEAGYFHCLDRPIVYFCAGLPEGAKFNLMLSASGVTVCTSLEDLDAYIKRSLADGSLAVEMYEGNIE